MIITRSPLRLSLGGGGTDLPSYYREHGGFFVAAAIDKYVYITLHQTFVPELIVKYSRLERVANARELEHPIVREAFAMAGLDGGSLEVASMADIPAGTGLGSSGAFTTALLKALHAHLKNLVHPHELAEQACRIEIERLCEPVGKQDQYVAAFGGLTCFEIETDGTVRARPLAVSTAIVHELEDNLILFFTGYSRSASAILEEQDRRSRMGDAEMLEGLHRVKELGLESCAALETGRLDRFAELMDAHWRHKRRRSRSMSRPEIDAWYDLALQAGARGGKLIGAGGGGFLLFFAENKAGVRRALAAAGLREVRFRFDFEGTKVVVQ